jgi:hypothetical protein
MEASSDAGLCGRVFGQELEPLELVPELLL